MPSRAPAAEAPKGRAKLRKAATRQDLTRTPRAALTRCAWADTDPELAAYHDTVWGERPASDDAYFERMMLEVFHAGLNWKLVWNKRDGIRAAFRDFNIRKLANLTPREIDGLLADPRIIRNRKKIEATVTNARTILDLQDEHGSFAAFLNALPAGEGPKLAVLKRTFKFLGPGVGRSFLHAAGLEPAPHHPYCFKAAGATARGAKAGAGR
ncbi:MAG: DNA-3-methyladenine glycosylase I [Actinobacteria bacterium]|nr:DNA-3-methyladenine glycosylase I [Actinomycetota bacterium]